MLQNLNEKMQDTTNALCWFIEWGHDHAFLVDCGFYPDTGPFGMEAMVKYLSEQGWAHISAVYMGES